MRRIQRVVSVLLIVVFMLSFAAKPVAAGYVSKVCNRSSVPVWVTVEYDLRQPAANRLFHTIKLNPNYCTNTAVADAEGIWGRSSNGTGYVLWKIGAAPFGLTVYNDRTYSTSPTQQIKILGTSIGGGWQSSVPQGWGWPSETVNYRLVFKGVAS